MLDHNKILLEQYNQQVVMTSAIETFKRVYLNNSVIKENVSADIAKFFEDFDGARSQLKDVKNALLENIKYVINSVGGIEKFAEIIDSGEYASFWQGNFHSLVKTMAFLFGIDLKKL